MAWLVDTNLFSERAKKRPNAAVLDWLEANAAEVYTSSHVIAEIQAGVFRLADGARRRALQEWLNQLVEAMEGRILNFNTTVAGVWAAQEIEFARKGCPMPMPDSFIAATARRYNLVIATLNTADYARPGLKVFNPIA